MDETGYEAFERMAFYGIASNLVVYLTTQLHEDTVSSVRNVNNWSGSVWITPLLGAYVADTYLGRFWTFTISSLIYVMVSTKHTYIYIPLFPPQIIYYIYALSCVIDDTTPHLQVIICHSLARMLQKEPFT